MHSGDGGHVSSKFEANYCLIKLFQDFQASTTILEFKKS